MSMAGYLRGVFCANELPHDFTVSFKSSQWKINKTHWIQIIQSIDYLIIQITLILAISCAINQTILPFYFAFSIL